MARHATGRIVMSLLPRRADVESVGRCVAVLGQLGDDGNNTVVGRISRVKDIDRIYTLGPCCSTTMLVSTHFHTMSAFVIRSCRSSNYIARRLCLLLQQQSK